MYDWGNQIRVSNNQSKFSAKKDSTIKLKGFEYSKLKNNNLINIPDTLIIKYSAKQKIITYENIAGSDQYLCGGLEIYLSDFEKRNLVKQNLKANFGPEFKISTIDEQHQEIFAWLNLIYQNVYIILILMIAVAVINMSCALLVLIVEKTKMIGILKLFLLALFSSDFKLTFKPENLTAVDGKFNLIFSDIIFPCFKKFLSRTITAICL